MGTNDSTSLLSRRVILLFSVTFLAYANISVFFHFYAFLKSLPIDPGWFGLLIGAFSAVSLIVRPVVSPLFHAGNARRFLFVGTALVIVTLSAYSLVAGFWSMLLVRILHGLAFVVMGASLMALTVEFIPTDRSAQFFGLLSVIILIPNTMIPPILPFLNQSLGGFTRILLLFAGVTILVYPFILAMEPPRQETAAGQDRGALSSSEITRDLKDIRIPILLSAMLLLYCGHALIFFFLDGYGRSIGITGTGFFLTLTTLGEISIRLIAGSLFDRMNKIQTAFWTLLGLMLAYVALAEVPNETAFFLLGAGMGLGWGVAMPVFNGLMFDISPPRFRAFNSNLGLQMFQGGFFLGPFIGAPVVAYWGFETLFHLCGALSFIAALLVLGLKTLPPRA